MTERCNIERTARGVRICWGDHERSEGCRWEEFVRIFPMALRADRILPCPFCGATPTPPACYYADQGDKWGRVVCGCGAEGPDVRTQYNLADDAPWHADAVEEWNQRAYIAPDLLAQ